MNDQHAKGTVTKARGKLEELLGRLTGSRRQQATGIAHQVEGSARQGVGDIQDAAQHSGNDTPKT